MSNRIVNLTQHAASAEQIETGVFELANKAELIALLNFTTLPTMAEVRARAERIAQLALAERNGYEEYLEAMIGGAPYLMAPLEGALLAVGICPRYAFSERVSDEKVVNGEVVKTSKFVHKGFV